MIIKIYKPYTPGTRNKIGLNFSSLSKVKPNKRLTKFVYRANGRNNQGHITIRHKGGGHKKLYRNIDFKRNKPNIFGKVNSIEYDPNRNCNISLINYTDGEKRYILCPEFLKINDLIVSGDNAPLLVGNALPIKNIPLGTHVHNIEFYPGSGRCASRVAGAFSKIISKDKDLVIIKLPSKKLKTFKGSCYATIGRLGNSDFYNTKLGKAGVSRWLGIRPTVRGSAMNPIDHPHGGGEGKCPIGRPRPLTPWGKAALGLKTRKRNKQANA